MSVGIKETKEALIAVDEVALILVANLKKGVFGEFQAFWAALASNEDLKAKLAAAWDTHQQIPAEVGDVDLTEAMDLLMTEASYIPRFLAALSPVA